MNQGVRLQKRDRVLKFLPVGCIIISAIHELLLFAYRKDLKSSRMLMLKSSFFSLTNPIPDKSKCALQTNVVTTETGLKPYYAQNSGRNLAPFTRGLSDEKPRRLSS